MLTTFSFKRWLSLFFSRRAMGSRRRRVHSQQISPVVAWLEPRVLLTTIDLATLSAAQGTTIFGARAGDNAGRSVSNAGDVNGDGFEDVIIGADNAGIFHITKTFVGESYLIFGSANPAATINLGSLGSAGVRFVGSNTADNSGHSVSGAGDVNGDGFDDLIIGAHNADGSANNKPDTGDSYLIFGSATLPSTINLGSPTLNGVTFFGSDAGDITGVAVSDAGDVNGDGFDDLIIGAPRGDAEGNNKPLAGDSYLIFGAATLPATIEVGLINLTPGQGVMIFGADGGDRSGTSVSSAGDVNGDGLDDLLVGASSAAGGNNAEINAGETFLIFGSQSFPAKIDLSTNLGKTAVRIIGADPSDFSGTSVSGAGDVDGDGFDDLIIGARAADAAGNAKSSAGESYLIKGRAAFGQTPQGIDLGTASSRIPIFGADANDDSGISVSSAGDFNADGFDDLIIGARRGDAVANVKVDAGESYLIFGSASIFSGAAIDLANLGAAGIIIAGATGDDRSGESVSGAGDVNGDGFDDLIIGAYRADALNDLKAEAGEGYIIFGNNSFTASVTQLGTSAGETLPGTANADIMNGGRGDDVLQALGGADVLNGAQGNDVFAVNSLDFKRIVGGTGTDALRLEGSGHTLNLTALRDNRISGLEAINISGSGNNVLILNQRDVLNLSDSSNTLVVRGNAGDRVELELGWTQGANQTSGTTTFLVFTQGKATLKIDATVSVKVTMIDLARLTTAQGSTLFGADKSDFSGRSVSSAGDFNGDGFDDILIGAPSADAANNSKPGAGDCYVIFGSASPAGTVDLANLGSAGVTIFGATAGVGNGSAAGTSVSGAGDVNGDGFGDLILGAPGTDVAGVVDVGASFIIFGGASLPSPLDLAALTPDRGITISGIDSLDNCGSSVSGAGDLNGDGFADVIIGARGGDAAANAKSGAGESYVIFGAAFLPATINLSSLALPVGMTVFGAAIGDSSGSVGSAGDVNGDGLDDLIIGASSADPSGRQVAGESDVIFGNTTPPASIDLASLGTNGFRIQGAEFTDGSGVSVSGAGDVNGDGFDDLIVGAKDADAAGNQKSGAGESYVIFGRAAVADVDLANLGPAGITIFGAEKDDNSGSFVRGAGDFNGDGFDDFFIGVQAADTAGNNKPGAGESVLIFGASALPTTIDLANPGPAGITNFGADQNDQSQQFGSSVASAGDVNGDGFDDLVIGAPFGAALNNQKAGAGESYIIFGGNGFTSSVTLPGTDASETLTGTAAADVIVGGRGNDTLNGSGGADVLIGAQGNDAFSVTSVNFKRIAGGNGNDTLRLSGSGVILDLTTLPDNRLTGIEAITITGSGNNTLTFNKQEVLSLSDNSNTLTVRRNLGDIVNKGAGWIQQPNETIGGVIFEVFTQGPAILKLQAVSNAPVIGAFDAPVTYIANGPAVLIDADATVTDSDSANFNGGELTFSITANGQATDLFAVQNQGVGVGQIGVNVANITFGGVLIGTKSGGSGSAPLVIKLNNNATASAVQALLRNVQWKNTTNTPSTLPRTVSVSLSDGDGGLSSPLTKLINVSL